MGEILDFDGLLTVKQAAALVGVHEQTIRRWIRLRAIEAVLVGPHRRLRIPRDAIIKRVSVARGTVII